MRKFALSVTTLAIVAFFMSAVGVQASPYVGALTSFIHSATSVIVPPPTSHLRSSIDALHQGPAATVTAATRATPAASPTPTLHEKMTLAVERMVDHARPPGQRINLLVLGSDDDAKNYPGATPPTQVIMVVSIDPMSRTVTLFSIPRDSWVHIPGYAYNVGPDGTTGWDKIAVASQFGFSNVACTIEQDFGIHIDNWVWVGLQGFIQVVNTVHGVTITVPHPVLDDAYPDDLNPNDPYAYRRIYLPPGPQHLNGPTALLFVRSRHGDISSDFGRSARQQIVITALRHLLLSEDMPSLVAQAPALLQAMQGNLKTDVSVDLPTVARYFSILRAAAHYKISQVVLSGQYSDAVYQVMDQTPSILQATNGQPVDAVRLHWDLINPLVQSIFGPQDYSGSYCTQN